MYNHRQPRNDRGNSLEFIRGLAHDSAGFDERYGVTRQGFRKRAVEAAPFVVVYVIRLDDIRAPGVTLAPEQQQLALPVDTSPLHVTLGRHTQGAPQLLSGLVAIDGVSLAPVDVQAVSGGGDGARTEERLRQRRRVAPLVGSRVVHLATDHDFTSVFNTIQFNSLNSTQYTYNDT